MNVEKVEKLIEIVRGYTFMYDLSHHQYKNAHLKAAIWESIGKDLNETGEAVRNKWKTIRDGYIKFKKQQKCSTGSSRKNINYTWASQLSFLDNFNVPRVSSSNISITSNIQQPSRVQTPSIDSDDLENSTSQFNSSPIPSTLSSSQI